MWTAGIDSGSATEQSLNLLAALVSLDTKRVQNAISSLLPQFKDLCLSRAQHGVWNTEDAQYNAGLFSLVQGEAAAI